MNMKYLKYLVLSTLVVSTFSCQKFETPVFTDKPSFEFRDTVASAPMGFIAEGSYTQKLVIRIFGRLPENDMKVNLIATGSAQSGRDFKLPEEIIFPKGESEITVECEIFSSPELTSLGDRDLVLTFALSDETVKGVRPQTRIKIETDLPSQWIGYEEGWFALDTHFGKCTKAKYQYFYKIFGFYDLTTIPEFSDPWMKLPIKLGIYAGYLNSKIDEENEILLAAGKETLKDDDGSELRFKQ